MKKLKLIRDGMNKPFKLSPWGPNEETLSGQYRPMTPTELDALRLAVANDRTKKTETLAAALARHVLKWDIDGEAPSAENIARLPAAFLDGLELIVTGYVASGAEDDEKKS
ncbi:MAG: hypothetical protein JNK93_16115 [Planctomycetia bacterium]|nr:hypothetical protein [Planctomycetia bacterium]